MKIEPVMRESGRREIRYKYIDSGQHARTTSDLRQGLYVFGTLVLFPNQVRSMTTAAKLVP